MRFVRLGAIVAMLMGLGACYDTPKADISFRCGPQDECPDGYECRDDGCCHLIGSSQDVVCTSPDASPAVPDAAPADAPLIDAELADADLADADLADADLADAAL